MAGKKSVIETGVDKLVKLINTRKKISVKDAARELGVSVSSIEEWADFLEEEGIINIQTHLATVYLTEKKVGKKELVEKVKEVKEEKDAFLRRVESSMNTMERSEEELKLMGSECRNMRSLLEEKFSALGKKLDEIEDFRKGHGELGKRHRKLEDEYAKKLDELDKRLREEEKKHKRMMEAIEHEIKEIDADKGDVSKSKEGEKALCSRLSEINRMIDAARKEIEKGDAKIALDEERLKRCGEAATKMRDSIRSTSEEIDELSKKFKASRKELESMESDFLRDVEHMSKGQLNKIGPYKEGKELVAKLKKFFDQTKDFRTAIESAEREEQEIKAHFEKLSKKVKAFSVVASVPGIKEEMAGLHKELAEIESRKDKLSAQLTKLRGIIRSLAK